MQTIPTFLAPLLALAAPLLMLLVGLLPSGLANARPRLMAQLNGNAAWLTFGLAILAALGFAGGGTINWTLYSIPLPGDLGAFTLGAYVNSVTIIMLLLVSFVGAVVSRYARNYLAGEAEQGRFHKWLSLTLASILTVIVASNLLVFALAWIATSLCLHQLLVFYRERRAAVVAAHKKFIISRIGDLSLLVAIFLVGYSLQTLEFAELAQAAAQLDGELPLALHIAAVLVVVTAALKSAQLPFHGWLIQVMEAPTPVSALLHAGIVNAGAFLVLRMSPIVSQAELALVLLALIGLTTLAIASLVMLTQTSIKVSLAWSTTAQMGFMLLECGLGLYSLALLHLVAHSLYKAHAFLASGSGVDSFRAPGVGLGGNPAAGRLPIALAIGVPMTLAIGAAFGITLDEQPALLAAGAIVAIAMSQWLLHAQTWLGTPGFVLRAIALSAVVCTAYFILHAAFEHALLGEVVSAQALGIEMQSALAAAVIAVFLALLVLPPRLKAARSPLTRAAHTHLYNGLYIDPVVSRLMKRLWPCPMNRGLATSNVHGG